MMLAAIMAIGLITPAHEAPTGWSYDKECCGEGDCHSIPAPQPIPEGYLLPDGATVGRDRIRKSKDGDFHVCRRQWHVYCLYEPEPST